MTLWTKLKTHDILRKDTLNISKDKALYLENKRIFTYKEKGNR
jgi:hypothetical protein